jgi:hypothetical protein
MTVTGSLFINQKPKAKLKTKGRRQRDEPRRRNQGKKAGPKRQERRPKEEEAKAKQQKKRTLTPYHRVVRCPCEAVALMSSYRPSVLGAAG